MSAPEFSRLNDDKSEELQIKQLKASDGGALLGGGAAPVLQATMGASAVLVGLLVWLNAVHEPLQRRLLICAIPSIMMLFLSLVAYKLTVPTNIMSAFQHLAAGLLVSAVACELVPTLLEAPNDIPNFIGIVGGFAGGICMLMLLSTCCDGAGDEDEDEQEALARTPRGLTNLEHARRAAGMQSAPYPFALVAAVTTDAFVDGLLVGMQSGSSLQANAGLILSLALAVEMGFTGLAYASTMRKQPPVSALLSIALPPLVLQVGALVGAIAAAALTASPATHTALVSFGVSALLYLVTVELLHEAHQAMDKGHIWWVEMMFFIGFLAAVLLEKLSAAGAF